jgi:hypothetical protein
VPINDHVFAVARPMIIDLKSNDKSNILKPVISFYNSQKDSHSTIILILNVFKGATPSSQGLL